MEIIHWNKIDPIFDGYLDTIYADKDQCDVFYVPEKGFCVLNHAPKYSLYERFGMDEIQDVFVLPEARRQGVAKVLIQHCEAVTKNNIIGISVPVSGDFGPAQMLYASLGYAPDGNGVTYDRQIVQHGEHVRVDDNLCLMLIKHLD